MHRSSRMLNLVKIISRSKLIKNTIRSKKYEKLNYYSIKSLYDDIDPIEDLRGSDKILSYAMKIKYNNRHYKDHKYIIIQTL